MRSVIKQNKQSIKSHRYELVHSEDADLIAYQRECGDGLCDSAYGVSVAGTLCDPWADLAGRTPRGHRDRDSSLTPQRPDPRVLRPVSTKPRQVVKIAILDVYQNVALSIADWSAVARKADITVFNDHIGQTDALIERLRPFDAICVMRERTPLGRDIIERLPRLRLIASTGPRNISIDMA